MKPQQNNTTEISNKKRMPKTEVIFWATLWLVPLVLYFGGLGIAMHVNERIGVGTAAIGLVSAGIVPCIYAGRIIWWLIRKKLD